MLLIGLTGGIGSGKSTVSAQLAERGAVVIDADRLAREVVEPGEPALAAIFERFGEALRAPDGTLNRPALAAIVFADPAARKDLERITHPAIAARMAARMAAEAETDHIVILDVPLMVESGRFSTAGMIVVDCPEDLAVRRLVEQRGMPEEDARRRMQVQATRQQRLEKADFVIDNSGSLDDLKARVAEAWDWIGTRT
jgi:dephospho-CoA kinase